MSDRAFQSPSGALLYGVLTSSYIHKFTHLVEDDWQLASSKHELWTCGRMGIKTVTQPRSTYRFTKILETEASRIQKVLNL